MTALPESLRPAPPPLPDAAEVRARLGQMLRIRRLEERCAEEYARSRIRGFLHLYIGEEAVAVGVLAALGPRDRVVATYREHGHALIRGVPARAIMAEMFGKQSGVCRGRGGSMHLFSAAHQFYGGHAIVGSGLPVAVGLALADRMQGSDAVTACFFGEGAAAEGEFHEALNLAALWQLPVLFVCENNRYAMGTALDRSQAEPDLARRAASYRVEAAAVDGMDVIAVEAAARLAVDAVRARRAPGFLEARTYRFRPHSMFDPELYRDKAEVEAWRAHDPIATLTARALAAGLIDDAALTALDEAALAEMADAVEFAQAAPLEPVADLARDLDGRPR